MFGGKFRSWMEAVRSRKKQHRKEKQAKCNKSLFSHKNTVKWDANTTSHGDYRDDDRREGKSNQLSRPENQCRSSGGTGVSNSRYSANNLSSPESAYSTGYSTDGTSPGAPPEYMLSTKAKDLCQSQVTVLNHIKSLESSKPTKISPTTSRISSKTQIVQNHVGEHRSPIPKKRGNDEAKSKYAPPSSRVTDTLTASMSPTIGLSSPRQRNRIRTNPWLPSGTLSPSPVKHDMTQVVPQVKQAKESPSNRKFLSPVMSRRRSISSSSCSSLSATSIQLDVPRPCSVSNEDFTLNEMMGNYDESYVYEKETDILSDSDPTECDTDIDTGQDGGDEDDPLEGELDFIDNGSHVELEARIEQNTGHCSYFSYEVQRKRSSRKKTQQRRSKSGEKKRRSSSTKKRQPKLMDNDRLQYNFIDGSKSAGATPVSVRRADSGPVTKLALDDRSRKRSNSVSLYRDPINTIDKRDKEADLKYRELITEAEQILRAMKTNGLSPRRVPGPANKRVELLRYTECAKPDVFVKKRAPVLEDNVTTNPFCSKLPSTSGYHCPRFSPKKNHITKFIISHSPVLARKEWETQAMMYKASADETHHVQKGILLKDRILDTSRMSPKHRRKFSRHIAESSSDSGEELRSKSSRTSACPQSEPVRRKVYFGANTPHKAHGMKSVAFNMAINANDNLHAKEYTISSENLRQQVLLNTIANLKRNLEDHSASLKQVYRSSHDIYT